MLFGRVETPNTDGMRLRKACGVTGSMGPIRLMGPVLNLT